MFISLELLVCARDMTYEEAAILAGHRHLRNIDCLMARTACLVCFISTVNGHSKRKRKETN